MPKAPSPRSVYETKLRQQQELLVRSMQSAVEQGRDAGLDDTQDVADQAVASYQKEFLFSQGTKGHAQMQLVRQALERLQDGSGIMKEPLVPLLPNEGSHQLHGAACQQQGAEHEHRCQLQRRRDADRRCAKNQKDRAERQIPLPAGGVFGPLR